MFHLWQEVPDRLADPKDGLEPIEEVVRKAASGRLQVSSARRGGRKGGGRGRAGERRALSSNALGDIRLQHFHAQSMTSLW